VSPALTEVASRLRFSDALVLEASPTAVWDLLLDPDRFAACVPGIERVRRVDERTFDGAILASVGPMSGTFDFRATILDTQPLDALAARVHGTDSVTHSQVDADMQMRLSELTPESTELRYETTVQVDGRLALLGDMLLRATGTVMLREFGARLRRQLVEG
jgi:carbon monoxide dehydrogenase subunit G